MNRIITKHELWSLSNEQIAVLTKGKNLRIVLLNGEKEDVYVDNLLAATNPPHLFCGFITSDNHTIYLQAIDYVEII